MFTTALNHIIQPSLSIDAFFSLANSTQCSAVEIRNDLDGTAILDGTDPMTIKRLSREYSLDILSINALQKFNLWNAERFSQANELFDYAQTCGAAAVVLVPENEGILASKTTNGQILRDALKALKPLLESRKLIGLVEPLGFDTSSLRLKREAVSAICDIGGTASFALVHDTFHHYVSQEEDLFPEHTGLIHASGVTENNLPVEMLRDEHRTLIDGQDILNNTGQIAALVKANKDLAVSLEPFSPELQNQSRPLTNINNCIKYLKDNL